MTNYWMSATLIGGSSQFSGPKCGITMGTPALFFIGLPKVHIDCFPSIANQFGLITVRPVWIQDGHHYWHWAKRCVPFNHSWFALTASWKTMYSGGEDPNKTELGCKNTSSLIPTARYGIPRHEANLLPESDVLCTRSFRTATWSINAEQRSCLITLSLMTGMR